MKKENVIQRIDMLLKHINLVQNDIGTKTLDEFRQSDLLVRGTCFSIVQVGEQLNALSKHLAEKYPEVPWTKAVKMRNIIVHVYNVVKAEIVYDTAKKDLPGLKEQFIKIKQDLLD